MLLCVSIITLALKPDPLWLGGPHCFILHNVLPPNRLLAESCKATTVMPWVAGPLIPLIRPGVVLNFEGRLSSPRAAIEFLRVRPPARPTTIARRYDVLALLFCLCPRKCGECTRSNAVLASLVPRTLKFTIANVFQCRRQRHGRSLPLLCCASNTRTLHWDSGL